MVLWLELSLPIHGDIGMIEFFLTSDLVSIKDIHNSILSQYYFYFIFKGAVILGDHWFVGNRKGADQILANSLQLNNNLFRANLQSLV